MYQKNLLLFTLLITMLHCGQIFASVNNKLHDYRNVQNTELQRMQEFHLQQAKAKIAAQQDAHAWGDLAYLLCHIPNHHVALKYLVELAPVLNKQEEIANFLLQAMKLFPEDEFVQDLYQSFLATETNRGNIATNQQ